MITLLSDDGGRIAFRPPVCLVTSESRSTNTEVTEFPVEKGAPITDHARMGARVCDIRVKFTEHPHSSIDQTDTPWLAEAGLTSALMPVTVVLPPVYDPQLGPLPGTPGYLTRSVVNLPNMGPRVITFSELQHTKLVQLAWLWLGPLLEWQEQSKLINLISTTILAPLPNAVITAISPSQQGTSALEVSISFRQLTFVELQSVKAPQPLEPRGATATNRGAQGSRPIPAKELTAKRIAERFKFLMGGR